MVVVVVVVWCFLFVCFLTSPAVRVTVSVDFVFSLLISLLSLFRFD